jgi:hypothetical protein
MVEFKSKPFIWVLFGLLVCNVLISLFMLLSAGNLLALPGLLLSCFVLLLMYKKDEYLVLLIKIWAGLLCVGGFAGLLSMGCACVNTSVGGTDFGPEFYSPWKLFLNLISLGIGLYYFIYSTRYIVKTLSASTVEPNNPP